MVYGLWESCALDFFLEIFYACRRLKFCMELNYYIQKSLIELGFSEGESKVYFEVLRRPGIDAGFLLKACGFSSAGVYKILNNLVDKGILVSVRSGKMSIYYPVPLGDISKKLSTKVRRIKRISDKLLELDKLSCLPEDVQVHEENDLTDFYLNIPYKIDDFIWCIGSFEAVQKFFGNDIEKQFISTRLKKGKTADAVIFDESDYSKELAGRDVAEKRETRFVRNGEYPLEFSYLFGDTYLNFYRDSSGKVKMLKADSPSLAKAKNIQYQMLFNSTSQ